ncbi:MAG: hypothetical protein ACRCTY_03050 [Candidatus Adiutrix sp.]
MRLGPCILRKAWHLDGDFALALKKIYGHMTDLWRFICCASIEEPPIGLLAAGHNFYA